MPNLEPRAVQTWEPGRPNVVASALLMLWIALLSLPMWAGRFLAGEFSDQLHSGYAFRHWLAEEIKRTGRIPLWNPELFGGMPFVGAMHGDIFYPTAWLRLILPTGTAMTLGFVIHYVLAGLFCYLLLRRLRVSWAGALTGGMAYQLSGVIGSYVQPGHDGKLFVTALLPLALLSLVMAMRDRRWEGYGLLALTVGLSLISPHAQMTYYMLIAAGLFALYLAFHATGERPMTERLASLGLALAAVAVGFGIGMIQLLPFFEYLPYSPRAEGYYGFEGSTSYAIPWVHVPEFFLSGFVGTTFEGTYWGSNPLKLHSEYLGLPVVALAVVGWTDRRRRLVYWLSGIGILFLLISLGAATPFYRLWWTLMPFVKQTRAPGMALYVVALVLAVLAGLGVERLERDERSRWIARWVVVGGVVAVLGLLGVFGAVAESLAQGAALGQGRQVGQAARDAAGAIRVGAVGSGIALLALAGLVWLWKGGRLPARVALVGIPLLVGGDLWRNAQGFWRFTDSPAEGPFAGDDITTYLDQQPLPFRVLDLTDTGLEVYRGSSLMAYGIPQLLGHHGNQLHHFNQLMGGKNQWNYLFLSRRLWDLYAVRFVLLQDGIDLSQRLPAFRDLGQDYDTVMTGVPTAGGALATLLERRGEVRYAHLVGGAVKVEDDRAISAIADPRSRVAVDRVALLDTAAAVDPEPLDSLPPAHDAGVRVSTWEPGHMTLEFPASSPEAGFLVVAENYYPAWRATVDGRAAPVYRGQVSQITVPVPAGAREVDLVYESDAYLTGRLVSLGGVLLVALGVGIPPLLRRRRA